MRVVFPYTPLPLFKPEHQGWSSMVLLRCRPSVTAYAAPGSAVRSRITIVFHANSRKPPFRLSFAGFFPIGTRGVLSANIPVCPVLPQVLTSDIPTHKAVLVNPV